MSWGRAFSLISLAQPWWEACDMLALFLGERGRNSKVFTEILQFSGIYITGSNWKHKDIQLVPRHLWPEKMIISCKRFTATMYVAVCSKLFNKIHSRTLQNYNGFASGAPEGRNIPQKYIRTILYHKYTIIYVNMLIVFVHCICICSWKKWCSKVVTIRVPAR